MRNANSLAQEVDAIIRAAIQGGGVGTRVNLTYGERTRVFRVDHMTVDDHGSWAEVWLSAYRGTSLLNLLRGVRIRDMLRVVRIRGDVSLGVTKVAVRRHRKAVQLRFREEVGVPRLSRAVTAFQYPRPDASRWLQQHISLAG